jgi:hypothetical protein
MSIMRLRRCTREVQFGLELEELLQERIGVGQVVDPKVAKMLLEVTGNETGRGEASMSKTIQRACQALISSAFLRGCGEFWLLAARRTELKGCALGRVVDHVHRNGGRWGILGYIQGIECKRAIADEPSDLEASTKGLIKVGHRGDGTGEEEVVNNFG